MRIVFSLIVVGLIAAASFKGNELYQNSREINKYKYDFAEINKINYGLFNIDIWKEKIFSVIERKAKDFDFNTGDLGGIRKEIENYLYGLHSEYIGSGKLVEMFMADNKQENKLVGLFMNLFKGNIENQVKNIDFKAKIPGIADQMMLELQKKMPEIKKGITEQVSNMLVSESSSTLNDRRHLIYEIYGVANLQETNTVIKERIAAAELLSSELIRWILILLTAALILLILVAKYAGFRLAMVYLSLVCVCMLALGLAMPMIDLDARLSDVDLKLIGEEIHFDEQVMYFQSKSILDVTRTLLEGHAWDMKLVGFLILLFSIILPFAKMMLTVLYLFVKRAKQSRLIRTVIFYLGKWSMADVFVVAIFMSYIGFYGLLNSQLASMAGGSDSVSIETVNYSSFAPGIIFFTLYCLLSIIMSTLIHRKMERGILV